MFVTWSSALLPNASMNYQLNYRNIFFPGGKVKSDTIVSDDCNPIPEVNDNPWPAGNTSMHT